MVIEATLSGDIYLKSRRTKGRMIDRVVENLGAALLSVGHSGTLRRRSGHRLEITDEGLGGAEMGVAATVFGIGSVAEVTRLPADDLETLAQRAAALVSAEVAGRTFAVRPKRRGRHPWRSQDLAVRLGDLLRLAGGRVDLGDPEVTVRILVDGVEARLVRRSVAGPGGLPLGTQERILALVSGGFDSVVAAWMMMSRGADLEVIHFTLDCAQSDHALAVTHELWRRWGHGSDPMVHVVEFQPVREALIDQVDPRMRQVTLKVLMAQAASAVAEEEHIPALVTGDSLGQVSSQTLPHLTAVSRAVPTPILRPLVGLPKEDIITFARRIGTAELSARAREVCDLSEGGPVATSAGRSLIARSVDEVPELLMRDAVATRKSFRLVDWLPGISTTSEWSAGG